MSAQVSSSFVSRVNCVGLVLGVCANLGARTGLPVWLLRTAFVLLALTHSWLGIGLYLGLAIAIRSGWAGSAMVPPRQDRPTGGVGERFSALDARLARMEAATLSRETQLRREFRDLEGK